MIFITGSTGFVGKSLYDYLTKKNYKIISLDLRKDIDSFHNYSNNFEENILIHTAWAGVLGKDRNNIIQGDNLKLTHKVLNIVNTLNITKLIAFGSQAEYGPCNIRVSEDQSLNPSTFYGKMKISCFNIFEEFYKANKDKNFIWLRLYDPYGPGDNPNWFIPYVIKNALLDKSPLLTECSQTWDYLYIEDLCRCLEKIINKDNFLKRTNSSTYNLSSDNPIKLKTIVKTIFKEINPNSSKPLFGKVPYRKDQQFYLHGNNTKICKEFSWSPKVSIKSGITKTIEHFRKII